MKKYWSIVIVILLIGCAKPYAQYYHDLVQGGDTSGVIFSTEEPKVSIGKDPKEDELMMVEEGYRMLGYSDFHGPQINQNQAIEKAKELKASVVILYSKYLDTKSGIQSTVIPDVQTSTSRAQGTAFGSAYGSGGYATGSATAYGTGSTTTYGTKTIYSTYNIDRFSQMATYWVKTKTPVLGAIFIDLPADIKQKIGSNKGAFVAAVVKETPAFSADIMRGDVIKKINNVEIVDIKGLSQSNTQNAGKKITITILRDGKEIVKEVKLNPLSEGFNLPK